MDQQRLEAVIAQPVGERDRLDRRAADVQARDDARDANHPSPCNGNAAAVRSDMHVEAS